MATFRNDGVCGRGKLAVAVVVLGTVTSTPVLAALDLTGTWQGKWKCKAVTGGAATKPQGLVTMTVTQSGGNVNALLDWEGFGSGAFQGHVQERIDKPGQGATTLLACSTLAGSSNYAEALSANVKVSSSTATLKGVSTYEELPVLTVGGTCKYSLKRTALADPGVAACPATCPTSSCGDGVTDLPTEECDDGNQVTEPQCAYGEASCVVCDATCQNVDATGPFCGDGVVDGTYETCDDGNASACGSCSANCKVVQQAQATGLIVPVPLSELTDGDSFTIDDGLGTTAVFEFDSDFNVSPGATAIPLDGNTTRGHAADKIAAAIDDHATLRVDPVANGPVVLLLHQVKTSFGNQAIVTSGISTDFYVTGMSGGMGGDCGSGVPCTSDADCASGQCGTNTPGICD
jgi:cysteine-rich repeat protein